ncbi:MAG TPA: murein L,D-transpeptidase, partial [Desulfopila sp.]|nr:murein L,D-transpeptidase [Desulfopila sp.]
HDTPARTLFSEQHRFFSHGCIRVYTPEKLAHFILRDNSDGWDMNKITETIEKGERKIALVRPSLDIHLTYQTAWLDKQGRIHFNRDIYERDKMLYKALSLR